LALAESKANATVHARSERALTSGERVRLSTARALVLASCAAVVRARPAILAIRMTKFVA
jgi:hypothetical protein